MCMTSPRQRGFTLIELIIFIVVVAAGLAGILSVMDSAVKSSADPLVRKQAMALADSILEEILLKNFEDPDPLVSSGETTRNTLDDVGDYHGKSNALFADLPASLASYSIAIAVVDDAATLGLAVKRVTVTVSRSGESVSLTGYRANY